MLIDRYAPWGQRSGTSYRFIVLCTSRDAVPVKSRKEVSFEQPFRRRRFDKRRRLQEPIQGCGCEHEEMHRKDQCWRLWRSVLVDIVQAALPHLPAFEASISLATTNFATRSSDSLLATEPRHTAAACIPCLISTPDNRLNSFRPEIRDRDHSL